MGCFFSKRLSLKFIPETGSKMFMKQKCVEKGKVVRVVAFCSASEHCVAHMVMFKGSQFHNEWKNGFSPGSLVPTSDLFLQYLKYY